VVEVRVLRIGLGVVGGVGRWVGRGKVAGVRWI